MILTVCDRCRCEITVGIATGKPKESGVIINHLCEECNKEFEIILDKYKKETERVELARKTEVEIFMKSLMEV